jgi:uncharacterized protein
MKTPIKSKVYFIKASADEGQQIISQKARKLFKSGNFAGCFTENDFTAIKVHVGENKNNTYVKAPYLRGLVDELINLKTRPFVTDTSTLYLGRRSNSLDHSILAAEHGFTLENLGAPFIISDGLLGTSETAIKINGKHNKEVFIAADIAKCQSILSVAHVTGHIAAGLGATLKTLGMGCASKKGKLKQHAAVNLIIGESCVLCGECRKHCPAGAITLEEFQARIDPKKCIGCAECMAFCRFGAVDCNWGKETAVLQESIAEHALGVLTGKQNKAVFFNFLLSVTKDCDCFDVMNMPEMVGDLGIIASTNPVAVDKAALDMIEKQTGKKLQSLLEHSEIDPLCQIRHAENIGLGSMDYEFVTVD